MPSREVRRRDVAYLPFAHQTIERVQGLVNRSQRVEAMHVIDVDVFDSEPLQAAFDLPRQVVAGRADIVRSLAELKGGLGRDEHAFTREMLDRFAKNLLGKAIGINVGGVEKIDSGFHAEIDELRGLGHTSLTPRAEEFTSAPKGSRAKAKYRDLQTTSAKLSKFHRRILRPLDDEPQWRVATFLSWAGLPLAQGRIPHPSTSCDPQARNRIVIGLGVIMEMKTFLSLLDERIHKYDLLCHPFYQAWSAGELTREDLREYAETYYQHVDAFPTYLAQLGVRLEEGDLRRAVLANMTDEKGGEDAFGTPEPSHAELWLDFVEGMGGNRHPKKHSVPEMRGLIRWFQHVASEGTPEEALAAFYAYESQVPRVAAEKDRGLREQYGADEKTRQYFTLHKTADVYHSQVWRKQLEKRVEANPEVAERALVAAESAARKLWEALDGIEARRLERVAA